MSDKKMDRFVKEAIGYILFAAVAVVAGEALGPLLGRWSYAGASICSLVIAKSSSGWKFE